MKSKVKKKSIRITLAIMVATSLLAGCGERAEENGAEKTQTSEIESDPEDELMLGNNLEEAEEETAEDIGDKDQESVPEEKAQEESRVEPTEEYDWQMPALLDAQIYHSENISINYAKLVKLTPQDSIIIEYPYIESDNEVLRKINEQIYHTLFDRILDDDEWADRAEVAYSITYVDERILSVYFTGYLSKGMSSNGGNFDIGMNFDLNNGELLCLADFYNLEEFQNLIANSVLEDKLSIADDIFTESECLEYINTYFINNVEEDYYIHETDNFFIREGKLCFLAKPFPSMSKLTILEMDIDNGSLIK